MFVEEKDCIKGQGLHVYKHQYKKFVVFLGLLLPWGKFYGFQINTSQTQPAFKMVLRIESADKSQSGEKSTYQILVRGTLLPQFALSWNGEKIFTEGQDNDPFNLNNVEIWIKLPCYVYAVIAVIMAKWAQVAC